LGKEREASTSTSSKNRATRPDTRRHRVLRTRTCWALPSRMTVRVV